MKNLYIVWAACACLLLGCQSKTAQPAHDEHNHEAEAGHNHEAEDVSHNHDHESEAPAEAHAGEIGFSDELAEAVGLTTQRIEPSSFTNVIKTNGRILAAQGEESTVVATVPGIVTFGNLSFVDGTMVSKGQTLLSLASSGLSDGDVAIRTRNAYETAKKEYERMLQLVGDQIVSAKTFEQARLNYENAKIAWDAMAGKQTANGIAVVSPIGGYLKNLQVKEGDYVSVGQPLATIAQNSRLVLRAEVSEKYYQYLPVIQSANFRTPYDNAVYSLNDLHGKLLSYGKSADANSYYIPVTFEFDNKGSVIPGSFVEIFLLTSPVDNVLQVPVSALIEEQGQYAVFVKVEPQIYKKVAVVTGANNGAAVQILNGLKAGDEVVTKGAYQIKLASASSAIPAHTHNH